LAELPAELVIIPKFFVDGLDDAEQDFERVPANPAATANVGKNAELVHDKPSRLIFPTSVSDNCGGTGATTADEVVDVAACRESEHEHKHAGDRQENFFVVKIFHAEPPN